MWTPTGSNQGEDEIRETLVVQKWLQGKERKKVRQGKSVDNGENSNIKKTKRQGAYTNIVKKKIIKIGIKITIAHTKTHQDNNNKRKHR